MIAYRIAALLLLCCCLRGPPLLSSPRDCGWAAPQSPTRLRPQPKAPKGSFRLYSAAQRHMQPFPGKHSRLRADVDLSSGVCVWVCATHTKCVSNSLSLALVPPPSCLLSLCILLALSGLQKSSKTASFGLDNALGGFTRASDLVGRGKTGSASSGGLGSSGGRSGGSSGGSSGGLSVSALAEIQRRTVGVVSGDGSSGRPNQNGGSLKFVGSTVTAFVPPAKLSVNFSHAHTPPFSRPHSIYFWASFLKRGGLTIA